MGAFSKPFVAMLMVAVFAAPLLAASHCPELIPSNGGSALQGGVATPEHDHCDALPHGALGASEPQPKFQPGQLSQLSVAVLSDSRPTFALLESPASGPFQELFVLEFPQASKQSLNCTFLI